MPHTQDQSDLEDQSGLEDSEAPQTSGEEESQSGLHMGDLLEDAKFYQDIAVELQTTYQTLEKKVHSTSTSDGGGLWISTCCRVSGI